MRRLRPRAPAAPGSGPQGHNFFFEKIEHCFDGLLEFRPESGALLLVPHRNLCYLLGRRGVDPDVPHQPRVMRARTRRRNSSRSISSVVLESISPSLCRTSASHADSASASDGPSRLATRLCANSARSASERLSASDRTFSRVGPHPYSPPCNEPQHIVKHSKSSRMSGQRRLCAPSQVLPLAYRVKETKVPPIERTGSPVTLPSPASGHDGGDSD